MESSKLRRIALSIMTLILALSMPLGLAGCKESLKLTEIIYDQTSEDIDYDNPMKILVQDENAEETSDALPLIGEEDPEDTEQDDPEPDEEQNQDDSTPSLISGDSGTGATSNNSGDQQSSSGSGMSSGTGTSTEQGDGDGESSDGNDDEGGTDTDGTSGARSGGDLTYYNDYGDYAEVPTGVDYVAAVGELATVVSMLVGDQGALKYCDAEWKSRDNLSRVLGSRYNSNVLAAWNGDGTDAGDISDEWIDALIADEELEAVLVMSGTTTLTSSQITRLRQAGIIVLDGMPDMTTASHITSLVSYLGELFAEGDEGWTIAQSRADAYLSFHDNLLDSVSNLVGTSATDSNGAPVYSSSSEGDIYTVYVDSWAINVTYADSAYTALDVSNGVGIVRLGHLWSPLTYYMSVGGAVSTAGESAFSGTTYLWQFNSNTVAANFTQTGLVTRTYTSGNWYDYTMTVNDDEEGLGTESFPAVVVKTQQMKTLMEADKSSSNQSLYKVYSQQVATEGSVTNRWVGPIGTGNTNSLVRYSTIGVLGFQGSGSSGQLVSGANYSIYVNPEGLFESWTDGSIESVLETAWTAWRFRGALSQSDVENYIRTFYSNFYGYTLSDSELSQILAGPES